jgi:hypothetical protein
MATTIVYAGTLRESLFGDVMMPVLDPTEDGIGYDMFNTQAHCIPCEYRDGVVLQDSLDQDLLRGKHCFDYVWTISGHEYDETKLRRIAKTVTLMLDDSGFMKENKLHRTCRLLRSDVKPSEFRVMLVRIFRDADFPCDEHPEFVRGCGQYHCPKCGDMQMGGLPHLPKENI